VETNSGWSAVDYLINCHGDPDPWQAEMIVELLAAGAPVTPWHTARVVPVAAAHAARREADLAALPSSAHGWRAHEALVGMSLDVRELREAEREVQERRARVEALEREMGGGTVGSSGSGSESGSESDGPKSKLAVLV